MTRIAITLCRVADDLGALRRRWALVGGLAVAARAEPRMTRDVDVAVASLAHMIALKVFARDDLSRPRDATDLSGLLKEASGLDLKDTHAALQLIAQRGFQRGKDLEHELERAMVDLR